MNSIKKWLFKKCSIKKVIFLAPQKKSIEHDDAIYAF